MNESKYMRSATYVAPRGVAKGVIYAILYIYVAFSLGLNAVVLLQNMVGAVQSESGNQAFAVSWIIMHGFAYLLFFYAIIDQAKNRGLGNFPFLLTLLLITYVLCTAFLAPIPGKSIVYAFMLSANFAFAYAMAYFVDLRSFLRVLHKTIVILIVLGVLFWVVGYKNVLYLDIHGRSTILGTQPIRGFFTHKIMASLYATMAIAISIAIHPRKLRFVNILLCGSFIVLTGSSTGIVLAACVIPVAYLGRIMLETRLHYSAGIFIGVFIVAPAISIALLFYGDILEFLGRDPTLTGRTVLWQLGLDAWMQKPFFGWGYKGYFDSEDAKKISFIPGFHNYIVPHFHQSFIQTLVDLGLPGFLLCVFNILYIARNSYYLMTRQRDYNGVAVFSITVVIIIASATMFLFYNYNHPVTIVMTYLMFYFLGVGRTGSPGVKRGQRVRGLGPVQGVGGGPGL